jgi:flavin reductase (DIM6/NTAB) family NADH-FMN oxidoreductase RutF
MYMDMKAMERGGIYRAMIQTIIPRPIAWVLSENQTGNYNLAPFSYFNAVSSDPPLVMLSMGKKPTGGEKDTRRNIRERSHFIVHIPHREQAQQVTASAAVLGHGESEIEELGLALEPFEGSVLPRLADCRIAMACRRYQILDIGPVPQALVLGEVTHIYVDDRVLGTDGRVQADRVDPLARLGGDDYATLGELITVPRR